MIKETEGGAHRGPQETAQSLKKALVDNLEELLKLDKDVLLEQRYQRYRRIGVFAQERSKMLDT